MPQRISDIVATLSTPYKLKLAIEVLTKALPIWDKYAGNNKLDYVESVVGTYHKVDKNIVNRCIEVANKFSDNPNTQIESIKILQDEFSDPIIAMQDSDWELPYPVERTFYAAHNLIEYLAGENTSTFGEELIYVSINQSLDALITEQMISDEQINELVTQFGNRAD